MDSKDESPSRSRVLDAAELLFAQRGFTSVTLRDIGASVGLTHAALYHYFPGGKEELFVEVTRRNILRHGAGLEASIGAADGTVEGRLVAAAGWLLSQPPMDLIRMNASDMPAIAEGPARELMELVYAQILRRLEAVLVAGNEAGEIETEESGLLAGALFGLVESLHSVPDLAMRRPRIEMARVLVGVVVRGLRPGHAGAEPAKA